MHVPLAMGLASFVSLFSLGLFLRSMYYLGRNCLTVDVQCEKYLRKLQKDPSPTAKQQWESMQPLPYRWDPAQQQMVPIPLSPPVSWSLSHVRKLLGMPASTGNEVSSISD